MQQDSKQRSTAPNQLGEAADEGVFEALDASPTSSSGADATPATAQGHPGRVDHDGTQVEGQSRSDANQAPSDREAR